MAESAQSDRIGDERERHGVAGANYLLPADREESERLDLQHRALKRAFDGRLFTAPVGLEELDGKAVLDNGTGTGVWPLDLVRELNQRGITLAAIDAFDITAKQYPSADALAAAGVRPAPTFAVGSVLALPTEWAGRFALIHQRLLIAALTASEWQLAVEQLFASLAPGGWLDLFEAGTTEYPAGSPGARFRAILDAVFAKRGKRGMLRDIVHSLPALLSAAGFVNVEVVRREIPLGGESQEAKDAGANFIGVYRGMKDPFVKAGVVPSAAEYDELMQQLYDQWQRERTVLPFFSFHAQKPRV